MGSFLGAMSIQCGSILMSVDCSGRWLILARTEMPLQEYGIETKRDWINLFLYSWSWNCDMWSWEPWEVILCLPHGTGSWVICSSREKKEADTQREAESAQFLMAFQFSRPLLTQRHFCSWVLRHSLSFTINPLFLLKLAWVRFLLLETQRLPT